MKRRLQAEGLIHDCLICAIFVIPGREKRVNQVVAGCEVVVRADGQQDVRAGERQEVAVRAGGRQEGAGELRLGAFPLHVRLLCLVTVVLEPDLDLCRAMRLSLASEVFVLFFRDTMQFQVPLLTLMINIIFMTTIFTWVGERLTLSAKLSLSEAVK